MPQLPSCRASLRIVEPILSNHPLLQYVVALALTLAVEIPIVAASLRRWYRVELRRAAMVGAAASLLTHPLVWFAFPVLLPMESDLLAYLLAAEGFAWLAEATLFWLVVRRDVVGLLLLSLAANLASFSFGVALWRVMG